MNRRADQPHLLATVLAAPQLASDFALRDWEVLVWQARASELLGQLYAALNRSGTLKNAPDAAQRHLEIARVVANKHVEAVQWELRNLREVLKPLGVPVILLKGAAYCAQANPAAVGRTFNDIDILVPKTALIQVENKLMGAGWLPSHTNAYDERYYRDWMHELPPMEHKSRYTVLDVHHTILAPTSGIRPDPQALFADATPLQGEWSFFKVLAAEDMVMHSACHLFFGEFHKGLRDLYDLHQLLSDFSTHPRFWEKMMLRAESMGLAAPVLDALHHSKRLFGTNIPAPVLSDFQSRHGKHWRQWAKSQLFDHVLRPNHSSARTFGTGFANWLAFARSHWLRMPVPLLIYHLSHKLLFK